MTYDAISAFLERAKKINNTKSRDMRMSSEEVMALSIEIAALLGQITTVPKTETTKLTVWDGGKMRP